jgi:Flp pilus assembly protein TadB
MVPADDWRDGIERSRRMGILSQIVYGPNVALALLGAAGVLAMFLALFAAGPPVDVARKLGMEEKQTTSLQQMLHQANLPITAGEFVRTAAIFGLATGILGFILLHTVTGAVMGAAIGPLAYWGYLGAQRDKTRRAYQEALARAASIAGDVIGRGGGIEEVIQVIAERGPGVIRGDFVEASNRLAVLPAREAVATVLTDLGEKRRDPILTMLIDILLIYQEHGAKVKDVLARLRKSARNRANTRKRILSEQARIRWTARIVSIAPFALLVGFRFTAPALVGPYYASVAGELTVLVAGLLSIASYVVVMRLGNRPLKIMETVFAAPGPDVGKKPPKYGPGGQTVNAHFGAGGVP